MKAIALTEEHKSKLLEMCKILFPKYKYYSIKNDDVVLGKIAPKTELDESDNFLDNIISIHWFEFCLTHLINELRDLLLQQNLINPGSSDSPWQVKQLMSSYYHTNYHPVDYLYAEFKKIKQ